MRGESRKKKLVYYVFNVYCGALLSERTRALTLSRHTTFTGCTGGLAADWRRRSAGENEDGARACISSLHSLSSPHTLLCARSILLSLPLPRAACTRAIAAPPDVCYKVCLSLSLALALALSGSTGRGGRGGGGRSRCPVRR